MGESPRTQEPTRSGSGALEAQRVALVAIAVCALLGAAAGLWLLGDDWSAVRRLLGGALAGAAVGFFATATKLLG